MASVIKRGNGVSVEITEHGNEFRFSVLGDDGTVKRNVLTVTVVELMNKKPGDLFQKWWESRSGVFFYREKNGNLMVGARLGEGAVNFEQLAVVTPSELPLLTKVLH
jgi:hypothetical protein